MKRLGEWTLLKCGPGMPRHRGSGATSVAAVWLLASLLAPLLLLVACNLPVGYAPTLPIELPPPVTVDLSTKVDSQGVLLGTVRITSSDGMLTATLPAGSRVLDAMGRPVRSLTLT